MSQTEKREWMYMRNKHIVFSYFSFSSHAFCFVYINLRLCWNHQLVVWVLHMNKLLSIQDRVSGWGQSPLYTPPPLPYRAHCRSHGEAGLCFILPCYFSVKGCQNLFSHLFPFTLSSCSFIWPFVPSGLLGWICLSSQCGESTLDKLILNTSYVILFITIKSKWLWAFPIAIFTHVASVS